MFATLAWVALLASPTEIRCEWLPDGAVVADPCPEFSWLCDDQVACRVTVRTDEAEIWDSGWLDTRLPVVEYAGPALRPGRSYRYRVEVRDSNGREERAPEAEFTFRPLEPPRLYPTIRSFVNFGADLDTLIRDYDVSFSREANACRPEMLAFCYSLMATMVVPSAKHELLVAFCAREGLAADGPLESMFLHYGEDTKVRLHIGREAADQPMEERLVPGWDSRNDRDGNGRVSDAEAADLVNPKATAREPRQARVPIYYWGPPNDDYVMYPGSPEYRRFLAEVYVPAQLEGYDGLYVDTMPPTPPGPAAGRVLAEYRATDATWLDDMIGLLATVKRAHPNVPLVGNAWSARPFVMDGMQRENWLGLEHPAATLQTAVESVRQLDGRGKMQWVQFNNVALDDAPTFAPRLPVRPERDQLYGVAAYLLAHGERTYYGYGRHPYGALWRWWPGCTKVDLGQPIAEMEAQRIGGEETDEPDLLGDGGFETPPTPPPRRCPGGSPRRRSRSSRRTPMRAAVASISRARVSRRTTSASVGSPSSPTPGTRSAPGSTPSRFLKAAPSCMSTISREPRNRA